MDILFEDNHLIAVNKKAGELVQKDSAGNESLEETVKDFIKERDSKPGNVYLGVIHRIDRPVSGIVLMAKSSKALSRMNNLMQERAIEKKYWAITASLPYPREGELVHYIKRNTANNTSAAHKKPVHGAVEGRLLYKHLRSSERYHLLEITLITGRHHQIRCQLAKEGYPIRGDLKYGAPRSNPDGGISLHSRFMAFVHPVTNERLEIVAPVPEEALWKYFAND